MVSNFHVYKFHLGVSCNEDPRASPFFKNADLLVIGDCLEVCILNYVLDNLDKVFHGSNFYF